MLLLLFFILYSFTTIAFLFWHVFIFSITLLLIFFVLCSFLTLCYYSFFLSFVHSQLLLLFFGLCSFLAHYAITFIVYPLFLAIASLLCPMFIFNITLLLFFFCPLSTFSTSIDIPLLYLLFI